MIKEMSSVRGVFSAKGPDASVGGMPVENCPDDDHMEEEVQLCVQVAEEGIGETLGKEQGKGQSQRTDTQAHDMDYHVDEPVCCATHYSARALCTEKSDV